MSIWKERVTYYWKTMIFPSILCGVLLFLLFASIDYVDLMNERQSLDLLKQTVKKATVECYVIEGVYPSDLSYLEENYGVVYDKKKFNIEYSCFSSNIMPTIVVYEK